MNTSSGCKFDFIVNYLFAADCFTSLKKARKSAARERLSLTLPLIFYLLLIPHFHVDGARRDDPAGPRFVAHSFERGATDLPKVDCPLVDVESHMF